MLVGSLTYASLGIDFLGDDYLSSAFTTMNSEWLQNHPDDWGVIPDEHHEYWEDEWGRWEHDWEDHQKDESRYEDWDKSTEEYSEESFETSEEPAGDDGFPVLDDLKPDYKGQFSGTPEGPDYYMRFYLIDENSESGEVCYYLAKGDGIGENYGKGIYVDSLEGADYNSSTNTLTLNNFTCSSMLARLMGNGFTIRLIGQNYIDYISIDSGSVTFEGNGTLICGGIAVDGDKRQGCIMIRRGVELMLTDESSNGAISIRNTTMSKQLWLAEGVKILNYVEDSNTIEHEGEPVYYNYVIYPETQSEGKEPLPVIIRTED